MKPNQPARWIFALVIFSIAAPSFAEDKSQLLTVDHYVRVKSSVPATTGQMAQIYVRERAKPATALRTPNLADRVVVFVHGAGTPAEVSFDGPHRDYSLMAYLSNAGLVVFSLLSEGFA